MMRIAFVFRFFCCSPDDELVVFVLDLRVLNRICA
ncbi:hypothetical protein CASFOL_001826 [Castilleja foliolosa]|uniref:Uncharacterized protein n=1 Tax=Castilleja foliolosa TaxID=1961234 RepID=A0ABD3ECN7_9LAMI